MQGTFASWCETLDATLKKRKRGVRAYQLARDELIKAFEAGTSPVELAIREELPFPPPPKPPDPPKRPGQPQSVLEDPRYQLDTNMGRWCPSCGSTNLKRISKPGTGLSYFGRIPFVLMASAVESIVRKAQPDYYQCNYCENVCRD